MGDMHVKLENETSTPIVNIKPIILSSEKFSSQRLCMGACLTYIRKYKLYLLLQNYTDMSLLIPGFISLGK